MMDIKGAMPTNARYLLLRLKVYKKIGRVPFFSATAASAAPSSLP
jgi:hypothetical protein